MRLFLILIIILSCGHDKSLTVSQVVSEFNSYYNKDYNKDIRILEELEGSNGVVGRTLANGFIEIKKGYWENATDTCRRCLLFHELGHVYGLSHDNNIRGNGRPKSLMRSSLFCHETWVKDDMSYYKEELKIKLELE